MIRPYVLAGVGGGLLVAVLAGVTMGNAAVEGINPIHYRAPAAPRQKAAAPIAPAPDMLARRALDYGGSYGWEAGDAAQAPACGDDCKNAGSYSASIPYFNSREELAEAERAARRAIDQSFAEETEAALDRKERRPRWADDQAEIGFVEEVIDLSGQE